MEGCRFVIMVLIFGGEVRVVVFMCGERIFVMSKVQCREKCCGCGFGVLLSYVLSDDWCRGVYLLEISSVCFV